LAERHVVRRTGNIRQQVGPVLWVAGAGRFPPMEIPDLRNQSEDELVTILTAYQRSRLPASICRMSNLSNSIAQNGELVTIVLATLALLYGRALIKRRNTADDVAEIQASGDTELPHMWQPLAWILTTDSRTIRLVAVLLTVMVVSLPYLALAHLS
jgi:hypothetical protein